MTERFDTLQVSTLTGASLRMLQYWDEQGVVVPDRVRGHGRGHWVRSYTRAHIKRIERLVELRRQGVFRFESAAGRRIMEHRGPVVFVRNRPVLVGKTLVVSICGKKP